MEIVRSLNISWIYDTYFSLFRPIHSGEKVRGEMSGGKCPDTDVKCHVTDARVYDMHALLFIVYSKPHK